ncbi:MAG: threonine synthase [Kiritimatiellae bacterium]|nr:threonine synthase [Kiritimatiellia bacterium]
MKYISTRGKSTPVDFETAVMNGLASDGGLFLPSRIPRVRGRLGDWRRLSYPRLAFEIIRLFCDAPDGELRRIIRKSCAAFPHPDPAPLVALRECFVLELFNGPTLAFKDFALQFLGNLFEYFLRRGDSRLNLVAATSGDTGSAAIAGVKGKKKIKIFVLYPFGRISAAQERQMTSVRDKNVYCLAVRGSFDDCQRIVKNLLGDLRFRADYDLGAVNSINWARIMAQIVYYFYAYFRVQLRTGCAKVNFAVPTGNFGDIFAGYIARRMGLPISRLILATNRNKVLADYFGQGIYMRGNVRRTLSPSMDIQIASNFERYLYYRLGKNPAQVRRLMRKFARDGKISSRDAGMPRPDPLFCSGSADDAATLKEIRRCYRQDNYILDPHTAVGAAVARRFLEKGVPTVCLATAHPAKFEKAVARAIGRAVSHKAIAALKKRKTRRFVLPADDEKIREFIAARSRMA